MNKGAFVHWDEEKSDVHINIFLHKASHLKAAMYDCTGKCILNVFDHFCRKGEFKMVRRIKDIAKGLYIMKFILNDEQKVIRFKVH